MVIEKRVTALEQAILTKGCATCRDWDKVAVVFTNDPEVPVPSENCPDCGRVARQLIVITERADGPK